MIDERVIAGIPTKRNVSAYLGLWLVVLSWVTLGLRVAATGPTHGLLVWTYRGIVVGAIVTAAAGVASIRARGEPALAIAVFAFSLVLPALYALVFLLFGFAPSPGGWSD
jgi:hypothetical protein